MRVSEHDYRPGLSQPRHSHPGASVSIILAGSVREKVGAREELAHPLAIVVKPPDTEHADEFGPGGARLFRIDLSPAEAANMYEAAPEFGRWGWTHGGPAVKTFLSLVASRRQHSTDAAGGVRVERLVWDTLAALGDSQLRHAPEIAPRWLLMAREALDDSASPPRLGELATLAGVHPVYLARQFRRFFGCSVSGYIHRVRVRRAADLMSASASPLTRVSLDAGFTDQAHMCRLFKRETGLSPTEYRELSAKVSLVQDGTAHAA